MAALSAVVCSAGGLRHWKQSELFFVSEYVDMFRIIERHLNSGIPQKFRNMSSIRNFSSMVRLVYFCGFSQWEKQ
jgi:hypothetical protein